MVKATTFTILVILSTVLLIQISYYPEANASNTQISLKDLGILQLAAHDLFNVDRGDRKDPNTATDFENGKLDLSTLFTDMTDGTSFELSEIAMGGETRNRENILLFSVASEIGQNYVNDINDGKSDQVARQKALTDYHAKLNSAYFNTFGESVPFPTYGCVTMTENLALRTVHVLLPGKIILDQDNNGNLIGDPEVNTLDFTPPFDNPSLNPLGHTGPLSETELSQLSKELNQFFDPAFNAINIFIPPDTFIVIDLEAADRDFGKQFNTSFTFDEFLDELEDGTYDHDEEVMKQIRNLFSKGYGHGCYVVGGHHVSIDTTSLLLAGFQSFSWLIPVLIPIAGLGWLIIKKIKIN